MIRAAPTGQSEVSGRTPLLGSPGTVLPVTTVEAESLDGFGSTGVLEDRVAVLVTGVVPLTVTLS